MLGTPCAPSRPLLSVAAEMVDSLKADVAALRERAVNAENKLIRISADAAEAARRHKQLIREASASRDAAALQSALAEAQSSHHSNAEQMLEDKEIEVASLKAQLAALEAKARRERTKEIENDDLTLNSNDNDSVHSLKSSDVMRRDAQSPDSLSPGASRKLKMRLKNSEASVAQLTSDKADLESQLIAATARLESALRAAKNAGEAEDRRGQVAVRKIATN